MNRHALNPDGSCCSHRCQVVKAKRLLPAQICECHKSPSFNRSHVNRGPWEGSKDQSVFRVVFRPESTLKKVILSSQKSVCFVPGSSDFIKTESVVVPTTFAFSNSTPQTFPALLHYVTIVTCLLYMLLARVPTCIYEIRNQIHEFVTDARFL